MGQNRALFSSVYAQLYTYIYVYIRVYVYIFMYVVPIITFDAEVSNNYLSAKKRGWMAYQLYYKSQYIRKHTYLPYCAD